MYSALVAFLLAFVTAVGTGPLWIPYFKRLKFGQFIREDGPAAHLAKQGTPTFGGLLFMSASFVSLLVIFFPTYNRFIFFPILALWGYGAIGFSDDYLKVVKKNNLGLSARKKIIGLSLVTVVLYALFGMHYSITFPFTDLLLKPGVLHFLFFAFVAVAITNAVNLTDGIDGLCGSVTLVVALFFMALAAYRGEWELVVVNGAMAGSLLGYLVYNWHPAKVFMGDTGSLGLGGFVLANALMLDVIWFIPIFGLIYVAETLSVIIQVLYFKKTGKRFFKMAPVHHHFEMIGWKEKKISVAASGLTAILCGLVYSVILTL